VVDPALAARVASELHGWRIEGEELVGRWRLPDFASALAAAVRVGELAERADHHPDMHVGWGKLEVRLTTHSAHALTTRDLDLARAVHQALQAPNTGS
jgi:4a-hydroxytetrahydrobiopterin dehydratase